VLNGLLDTLIIECDKALKTLSMPSVEAGRDIPGSDLSENEMTKAEKAKSIALMRVNHSGEVSAQALYQGQALTAKLPDVRRAMEQAAAEETEHLVWCQQRINHYGGHVSILNPLWYAGSFTLGAIAGKAGDKWSLGFVVETERQVVNHLEEHLAKISEKDLKSRAVLEQMKEDELHHGTMALEAGGAALPAPIKLAMSLVSKIMTQSSYRI